MDYTAPGGRSLGTFNIPKGSIVTESIVYLISDPHVHPPSTFSCIMLCIYHRTNFLTVPGLFELFQTPISRPSLEGLKMPLPCMTFHYTVISSAYDWQFLAMLVWYVGYWHVCKCCVIYLLTYFVLFEGQQSSLHGSRFHFRRRNVHTLEERRPVQVTRQAWRPVDPKILQYSKITDGAWKQEFVLSNGR